MDIKLIAVGNRLMGDDGVGLAVGEYLLDSLEEMGIQVIIGETDIDYCVSQINENDELIIIDSALKGAEIGSVTVMTLKEAAARGSSTGWQHDRDIISELRTRGLRSNGLFICIEAQDICFRWGLSKELQQRLPEACSEILDVIKGHKGGLENA